MKITLFTHEIADHLYRDRENNAFSWKGCQALAEYLEEREEGEDQELDVIAIRCTYSEYGSATEAVGNYEPDVREGVGALDDEDEDEIEERALKYLRDHTAVITFTGGIIIEEF